MEEVTAHSSVEQTYMRSGAFKCKGEKKTIFKPPDG